VFDAITVIQRLYLPSCSSNARVAISNALLPPLISRDGDGRNQGALLKARYVAYTQPEHLRPRGHVRSVSVREGVLLSAYNMDLVHRQ